MSGNGAGGTRTRTLRDPGNAGAALSLSSYGAARSWAV